jgi:myosin heavy subunit
VFENSFTGEEGARSPRGSFIDLGATAISSGNSTKKSKKSPVGPGALVRSGISKLKDDSISKQFTASLRSLCDTLDNTEPHFVRCMKPNSFKVPNALNILELRTQLRNAGMMETIRIRQQGYAFRQPHKGTTLTLTLSLTLTVIILL